MLRSFSDAAHTSEALLVSGKREKLSRMAAKGPLQSKGALQNGKARGLSAVTCLGSDFSPLRWEEEAWLISSRAESWCCSSDGLRVAVLPSITGFLSSYFLSGEVSILLSSNLSLGLKEPPEQVIVELQPAWVAVDEAFTVTCHVPSVTPLENLILTLLQDDQELQRKNFRSLAMASQRAEVTINVKAQREDDRCNFSCHAELDLNSHGGGLFHSNSALQVLRIFGESEPRCGGNPGAHFPHLTLAFRTYFP